MKTRRYIFAIIVLSGSALVCIFTIQKSNEVIIKTVSEQKSRSTTVQTNGNLPNISPHNVEYIDPLFGITDIARNLEKGLGNDEEAKLSLFELELKQSLKDGWNPPWSELNLELPQSAISQMGTIELAKKCFEFSLPARSMLLYSNPNYGIRRLEVLNNGFKELFGRRDVSEGLVAVIDMYSNELAAAVDDKKQINAIMGLTTLPELYSYPGIRKKIVGHEKQILQAHLRSLKQLAEYLDRRSEENTSTISKSYFSSSACESLFRSGMALGQIIAPQKYQDLREKLSRENWNSVHTNIEAKKYLYSAIHDLENIVPQ